MRTDEINALLQIIADEMRAEADLPDYPDQDGKKNCDQNPVALRLDLEIK